MSMEQNYPCLWNGPGTTRGPALILNYEFDTADEKHSRKGSKRDVETLENVLADLGYKMQVENDLTGQETIWALDDFEKEASFGAATTDSAIVVVMSHGISGDEGTGSKFFTEDGREFGTQYIVDRIQNVCSLRDKPKIFFFNICREKVEATGGKDGEPQNIEEKRESVEKTVKLHEDTLIVYSTLPRFPSYRKEELGSVFIQTLCNKLSDRTQVAQKDLVSLFDEVVKDMEKETIVDKETQRTEKQIPEIVKRKFTKKFYFIPFHKLRKHYLDHECKVVPLPWYPDQDWSVDEIYTELVIERRENNFPLEDLFRHAKERFENGGSYRIIIEGNPGYGKSTLMLKMASDWSKQSTGKNYMNQFRYVFLGRLGRLEGHGDIERYLVETYQDLLGIDVKQVLQGSENEQVLIILDGFDEANAKTKQMVYEIMESQRWSQCHVVLTSRFGYVTNFIKTKALCAVLKGFHEKQVAVAVGKHFIKAGHLTKEEAVNNSLGQTTLDDFRYVQERPFLLKTQPIKPNQFQEFVKKATSLSPYKELAQCPLLCAMMCCLVEDCPGGDIPDTLSKLYFAIINRNLYRAQARIAQNLRKNVDEWNWDELQNEFHDDHEEYLGSFGSLCVVYILRKSPEFTLFQIVGKKHAAKSDDPKVVRLIEAGVIIKAFESEKESIFHPTHRSMAEFLSAYYLTTETDTEKISGRLIELYSEDSSFYEIFNFCVEMGRGKTVADAFQDTKLAKHFVLAVSEKNGGYKNLEEIERLLAQIKQALPWDVTIPCPAESLGVFGKGIFNDHGSVCSLEVEAETPYAHEGECTEEEFVASLIGLLVESFSLECYESRVIKIAKTGRHSRPALSVCGGYFSSKAVDRMFLLLRGVRQSRIRLSSLKFVTDRTISGDSDTTHTDLPMCDVRPRGLTCRFLSIPSLVLLELF